MAADPISRLELARREIDRVFGDGHARAHPELVAVVVQSAASDWAAARRAGRGGGAAHRAGARTAAGAAVTDAAEQHDELASRHSITSSARQ
jgi:hypothetical protein